MYDHTSVDTLRVIFRPDVTLLLVPRHQSSTALTQWGALAFGAVSLVLAVYSARWAATQWRFQYFTAEWSRTVQFLFANAKYLDPKANATYKTTYGTPEELAKYELVARLSIGYVDDLYHLGMGGYLKSWMRGARQLFVAPHTSWLDDNRSAYEERFIREVTK